MRGEIGIINNILAERDDLPVKYKDKEELHKIISIINDEYWKEFKRKIDTSNHGTLVVKGLGSFVINYSSLKRYIRRLVEKLRKLKRRLNELRKNPNFNENNSVTFVQVRELTIKLKAANTQLNEQRKIYILRYLAYTCKKRKIDPNFQLKRDYTWFPYSFKDELKNNVNIDMKLITNEK